MKNFALIGASGHIAPRHLQAIKKTGSNLVAALDPYDSVGILDGCFPRAHFFTEFERFDRFVDKVRRTPEKIDYISICSPNYLHDAHIRFALKNQADAICEKPLVLNPWNIEALQEFEKETERKIYPILQYRMHPSVLDLKKRVQMQDKPIHQVDLTYIVPHGNWYFISWKGQEEKAGGVATHLGIHLFDVLIWIFGEMKEFVVHVSDPYRSAGYLELDKARVRWFISLEFDDLPEQVKRAGHRTYRSIQVNNKEIVFNRGFSDLHTLSYRNILGKEGFGLADALKSIEVAYHIRTSEPQGLKGDYHPLARRYDFPAPGRDASDMDLLQTPAPASYNNLKGRAPLDREMDSNEDLSRVEHKPRRSSSSSSGSFHPKP